MGSERELAWVDGRAFTWVSPHRVMLEHKLGRTLSGDEDTRHGCDTPACCEPSHLSPGSRLDNVRDMVARGRKPRTAPSAEARRRVGERNRRAHHDRWLTRVAPALRDHGPMSLRELGGYFRFRNTDKRWPGLKAAIETAVDDGRLFAGNGAVKTYGLEPHDPRQLSAGIRLAVAAADDLGGVKASRERNAR